MSPQVRRLFPAHAGDFQALRLRGLRECPGNFASSFEEECDEPLSVVAGRLADDTSRALFGAFSESVLVGVIGLQREGMRKLAHKAYIWGMYVAPEFRRKGVGRELVQRALQQAFAMQGVRQVNLGVNAANAAAVALYESVGFRRFGVEQGCMVVDGVLQDEVHMVYHGEIKQLAVTAHDPLPIEEARLVDAGLGASNAAAAPLHEVRTLSCFARLPTGEVIGGAVGRTWGACCELQQLWVEPSHRRHGVGSSLIREFERQGQERGCHTFYLETFSFQAPRLYRALGYEVKLEISGFSAGISKYTMVREIPSMDRAGDILELPLVQFNPP